MTAAGATDPPPSTSTGEPEEEIDQKPQGRQRLHGGRRFTRKELGSWDDSNFVQEVPHILPACIYNLLSDSFQRIHCLSGVYG